MSALGKTQDSGKPQLAVDEFTLRHQVESSCIYGMLLQIKPPLLTLNPLSAPICFSVYSEELRQVKALLSAGDGVSC